MDKHSLNMSWTYLLCKDEFYFHMQSLDAHGSLLLSFTLRQIKFAFLSNWCVMLPKNSQFSSICFKIYRINFTVSDISLVYVTTTREYYTACLMFSLLELVLVVMQEYRSRKDMVIRKISVFLTGKSLIS